MVMLWEALPEGCRRVLINEYGETKTPRRAREENGVKSDIVFVRRDGWSLGAPLHLERVAYELWADHWVSFCRRPDLEMRSICDYHSQVALSDNGPQS